MARHPHLGARALAVGVSCRKPYSSGASLFAVVEDFDPVSRARLEALLTILEPVAAMAVVVVLGHWVTAVAAVSARLFTGG